MQGTKLPFQVKIDVEIIRQPHGIRTSGEITVLRNSPERESGPVLQQTCCGCLPCKELERLRQNANRQRRPSPGMKPVGSVPGKRAFGLNGKDGILERV